MQPQPSKPKTKVNTKQQPQKRVFVQDIKQESLSADYVRMFNTINWKRKMTPNDTFSQDDPYYHLIVAIKHQTKNKPSRIRNRDIFINKLKKVTNFHVIDGYNKSGQNLYEAYQTFIDTNLNQEEFEAKDNTDVTNQNELNPERTKKQKLTQPSSQLNHNSNLHHNKKTNNKKNKDKAVEAAATGVVVGAVYGAAAGAGVGIAGEAAGLGVVAIGGTIISAPVAIPALVGAAVCAGIFGAVALIAVVVADNKQQKKRRQERKMRQPVKHRPKAVKHRPKAVKHRPKAVKPVKPVQELKEDQNDEFCLKKMLVIIICVGKYDGAPPDLPGTQKDLKNLVSLFRDQYKYKLFHAKDGHVTYDDMDLLLNEARVEFMKTEYDGIIVCFSGHGDKDSLLCSDYDGQGNGIFPRQDFNQWFDGNNCKSRIDKYKLYFLDACRGGQDIKPIINTGTRARGNMARSSLKNASENTCYMYGNSNWSVTLETTSGGMLTQAVVSAFTSNLTKSKAIGPLHDEIRKIAKGYGNDKDGVILPTIESNIDHEIAGKITVGIDTRSVDNWVCSRCGMTNKILNRECIACFHSLSLVEWYRRNNNK